MNKELSSALSDIEGALFGLEEVSDALCIYHGRMEDELAIIEKYFRGGSPEIRDRTEMVLSVLSISQKALKNCRDELKDAIDRAYTAARAQKSV